MVKITAASYTHPRPHETVLDIVCRLLLEKKLCLSPKSNSAMRAIDSSLSDIRNCHVFQIPYHLKDLHSPRAKDLGR
ncbi:hypothetical protein B8A02_03225, partial [Staphylococcus aureus]